MNLTEFLALDSSNVFRLSRKAGVAHTTIGRLLEGKSMPRRRTISKIAAATNGQVTIEEIMAEALRAIGAADLANTKSENRSGSPKQHEFAIE